MSASGIFSYRIYNKKTSIDRLSHASHFLITKHKYHYIQLQQQNTLWFFIIIITPFISLSILTWSFKTYPFDKEQKKIIISTKIKFRSTTKTQYSSQDIKRIEIKQENNDSISENPKNPAIVLLLRNNDEEYFLGNLDDLSSAKQINQSIKNLIQSSPKN